jgi:predicted kinase
MMRKWMRERLQRRKKEKAPAEAAPVPLQPAFYDIEPKGETPQAEAPSQPPEPSQGVRETAAAKPQTAPQQRSGNVKKRRRSRRRGGRSRAAQVAQVAAQPSPTAVISEPPPAPSPESRMAAATPPATTPRPSRGTVVLAIGLPGSGKSAWFKRHNITPLSSDLLRSLLFDDPTEQRFQDLVFSNLRSMLKARLVARRPMNYVDATNLTSHDRHGWIKLAKDYGYDVQAVFFDVPLEVCLERNRRRDRVVGEDVMRRMAAKLKPPTFGEGFSKITVVRVKQKP